MEITGNSTGTGAFKIGNTALSITCNRFLQTKVHLCWSNSGSNWSSNKQWHIHSYSSDNTIFGSEHDCVVKHEANNALGNTFFLDGKKVLVTGNLKDVQVIILHLVQQFQRAKL